MKHTYCKEIFNWLYIEINFNQFFLGIFIGKYYSEDISIVEGITFVLFLGFFVCKFIIPFSKKKN